MKYNPLTRQLFTNQNVPIKQLLCRYRIDWSKLPPVSGAKARMCSECEMAIIDTQGLEDAVVLKMVRDNQTACLKVDLSQDNVRVIHGDD